LGLILIFPDAGDHRRRATGWSYFSVGQFEKESTLFRVMKTKKRRRREPGFLKNQRRSRAPCLLREAG